MNAAVEHEVAIERVAVGSGFLEVLRSGGQGWLAVKPACEKLGIDAEAQRKRLQRQVWATTSVMEAVGADATCSARRMH